MDGGILKNRVLDSVLFGEPDEVVIGSALNNAPSLSDALGSLIHQLELDSASLVYNRVEDLSYIRGRLSVLSDVRQRLITCQSASVTINQP
jgi:hypothetical protein